MSQYYKDGVIITGGAGFIGSHLCDRFINSHNIFCIDNLISGRASNIKHLVRKENFHFFNTDVGKIEFEYLKNKFKDCNIKFIFHFASLANLSYILRMPIETALPNVHGTLILLELAKHFDSKFILASTSEIYGNPLEHPQKETYWGNVNPVGVRSIYDESKRFAETLTTNFYRQGVDTKIVRIFNTYGERMAHDGRVMINLIKQALLDEDMTVYGEGNQTRSFCYVDDLVDGIIKLAYSEYNMPFNLGNTEEITILNLAIKIKEIIDSKSKIVYKELPLDDPFLRQPDITKATDLLMYYPKIDLNVGIRRTIEYFRKDYLNII